MPDQLRSPREHYLWALEIWSIIQCPKTVRIKKDCGGSAQVDFSDKQRDYAVDILKLASAHESTGYMRLYFESEFPRAFWHEIPERYQGQVRCDIREFKRALIEGKYEVR